MRAKKRKLEVPTIDEVLFKNYRKDPEMFLSDFWRLGNKDFKIEIEPRFEVGSGRWYTATWIAPNGKQRSVTAQYLKLLWEQIIKLALADGL